MTGEKIAKIIGKGIVVRGNDVDTDRIIPARFLKEITFENMGKYAFFDERFGSFGNKKNHPFNDEKCKGASILVVNKNFGCGSSREHAPQSLMRFGIRAIIGESFADIFSGNCTMLGIPNFTASKKDIEKIMALIENNSNAEIVSDLENNLIIIGEEKIEARMESSLRKSLFDGIWDSTSLMIESKESIVKLAEKLPYINNFESCN